MTPAELEVDIRAAGLAWDIHGALVVVGAALDGRCNAHNCGSLAAIANSAGMTGVEIMPALIGIAGDSVADPPVAPDRTLIDQAIATGRAFKEELAARSLSWSCEGGPIVVWLTGDDALRSATEVSAEFGGAPVTTQDYRAQSAIAGASIADMAQALLELVGDPTADPPVAPDPTAFDLIMGA